MTPQTPENAEASELERIEASEFPHPYVAVDLVLLTIRDGRVGVLTQLREDEPPLGRVLPGAFVQTHEALDDTARRILTEKLAVSLAPEFEPLPPFGDVDRDPRRRVISLPYLALVESHTLSRAMTSGEAPTQLATVETLGDEVTVSVEGEGTSGLGFDHGRILATALDALRRRVKLGDHDVYVPLLPERYTLRQLQEVHEALTGKEVNRDSFRRRMLTSGRLEETGDRESDVEHRPAALYAWRSPLP